ncbi:MAG: heat shock protein HspQ [Alphaproteobacteria bacterium]|nr:MAG: heat shock protein HspQ [Alphaproteobacteria bacterium]
MPAVRQARFPIGAIVRHRILGYQGRVCDVDAECDAEIAGLSRGGDPQPRSRPWYHVLVEGVDLLTYVAEDQLENLDGEIGRERDRPAIPDRRPNLPPGAIRRLH